MDIFKIAALNQAKAYKIIEQIGIIGLWEEIGAEFNLVGSLKSGLLMKNLDIDFHIYTHTLTISQSFSVIQKLAENPSIKEIQYKNLIETEEECIEWHVWYEDEDKRIWKFDMIHIRKGSLYDGVIEKVTDTIIRKLTPETKEAILRIKADIPIGIKVMGFDIYRAVFSYHIRTYDEFAEWLPTSPKVNALEWMP